MPINTTLIDTEGFDWDIQSDAQSNPELGITDGEDDAFDRGMRIIVNGTPINPQNASLDGREVNAQPILIGGVAVQRSILVSDATISAIGFARFFDSFTNTTDAAITITVETVTNSGADAALILPTTSSGDTTLNTSDVGFVTSDGATPSDSVVMIAYGDGETTSLAPTTAERIEDTITITHTLTLQPGETQSLLQFATQNAPGNTLLAGLDLATFTNSAVNLAASNLLAGLSREEQLTIVNYSGFDTVNDPFELTDSEGNRWGIDTSGRLSTLDSTALSSFEIDVFAQNWTNFAGVQIDEANDEITIVKDGFAALPLSTLTYTYRALPQDGVIRLLVTQTNGGDGRVLQSVVLGHNVTTGSATAIQVNTATVVSGALQGEVSGVVLDDSASGSGGTQPALSYVFGASGFDDTTTLTGSVFRNVMPGQNLGVNETATYLFFFAINDSGLAALADLTRTNTPSPELLAGLSAAQVAALRNFDIEEFQGRLQEVLGANDVDDVLIGHHWGDSIVGGSGDDEISAGGSDDIARGGVGEDVIAGEDGADTLSGGLDNDVVTGGAGADHIDGDEGRDFLSGGAGNDLIFGGDQNDTLYGGAEHDSIFGGFEDDLLRGNTGNDTLNGDAGNDSLVGGTGDDSLVGDTGTDSLYGGSGNDSLVGGTGEDTLDGGEGNDSITGGEGNDSLIGGTNNDVLLGGIGNDSLFGQNENDILSGEDGNDFLSGGNSFDKLFGGANNDRLFGGADDDTLTGGDGDDRLDGGTGADSMQGGAGNDTYVFDNSGDTILDATGTADKVESAFNVVLSNGIENLLLTGTADTFGVGNGLVNLMLGNSGANFLDGRAGADTMEGGNGNDTYSLRDAGDVIREFSGTIGGIDLVQAIISHSLGSNVENLQLIGAAALIGTGNAADNSIIGGTANNVINGGLGNDELAGGAGIDTFVFSTAINAATNFDTILDFALGQERIHLSATVFTGMTLGTLTAGAFVLGTTALDADDRILYDATTGILRFDRDGVGNTAAVQFADIFNNAALSAGFFEIIA